MTARDSQRSKVYKAESVITEPVRNLLTFPECQALVDKILASPWTAKKFDPRTIDRLRKRRVKVTHWAGHGGMATVGVYDTADGAVFGPIIFLSAWARQPAVVIHELAHHIAGLHHGHDYAFAAAELALVRRWMGADAGDRLAASFKAHRVRTRPKVTRTLTDEQRAAAIANLTAARPAGPTTKVPTFTPASPSHGHTCSDCGRERPASKFPTVSGRPGEREVRCRECRDHK